MRLKPSKKLPRVWMMVTGVASAVLPSISTARVSSTAALTSDYVWSGSSQTREDPAMQANIKYTHTFGLYASSGGNNVKFRPESGARSAFDLSSCWSGKVLRDWALDLYLLRYHYLSANANLKWNELNIAATWQDNYWLTIGHSANMIARGTVGAYAQLVVRWPLNEEWRLEGSLARYFLGDAYADSSTHGALNAV